MGGISNYGRCCNRIIVSRQWRHCPFCGKPPTIEKAPTYENLRTTIRERDLQISTMVMDLMGVTDQGQMMHDEALARDIQIQELQAEVKDLTFVIETAALDGPRAPDIVVVDEDVPGISGGLATVQEACSAISMRGVNKGKPCIRPSEGKQKHATGRHRY